MLVRLIMCLFVLGNTAETDLCSEGYYCTISSESSTPTDGSTGNICGQGHYCPAGSPAGVMCPAGTFNNITGLTNASECEQCTPGYYCSQTGMNAPSGKCYGGKTKIFVI